MKIIKLGNIEIGKNKKTFFIAEAGINHNGKIRIAKQMVREAAIAGADAIKFQTFKTEKFYAKNSKGFDFFKKYELTENNFGELKDEAVKNNILFSSTPLDFESFDLLEKIKTPFYKIASSDLTFLPLIEKVSKTKKPIIISTGMGTNFEIQNALNIARKSGSKKIILMHSVSSYPTPVIETNLNSIILMAKKFKVPIGYSDNGDESFIPILASLLGAVVIEKHFTLNSKLKGADHKMSIEPNSMKQLIYNLKNLNKILGNGKKTIQPSVKNIVDLARRGVYSSKDLEKNHIIDKNDIIFLRPGNKSKPKFNGIIGKKLTKNIKKGDPIEF
jgi:N,N'-diacetyllegionaminate synthase